MSLALLQTVATYGDGLACSSAGRSSMSARAVWDPVWLWRPVVLQQTCRHATLVCTAGRLSAVPPTQFRESSCASLLMFTGIEASQDLFLPASRQPWALSRLY
jgi:hypothetical protein